MDSFGCNTLNSDIGQMAILLYPPELLNEKLLIKVRDCMINLKADHPIKKWVLAVSSVDKSNEINEDQSFLIEIINSKFNLITDQKVKNKVISILGLLVEDSTQKILLKSYLYLMIGNITRSDNLLLKIANMTPQNFYMNYGKNNDQVDKIVSLNLEKILEKFSRHPADRGVFNLFIEYLKSFTNQKDLLQILDDQGDEDSVEEKLDLRYFVQKAPDLCRFLKLKKINSQRYQQELQDIKLNSVKFQIQWLWPFLGHPMFYKKEHQSEVFEQDKDKTLWTFYLLSDEKLAELYASNSKHKTPSQQRQFLRSCLKDEKIFMLALFKLIQLGDVDHSLVEETSNHLLK